MGPSSKDQNSINFTSHNMYPTVDEKIMLEKRHGRRTPLPLHNRHRSLSNARSRRSIIIYVSIVSCLFLGVLYVLPTLSDYIYPVYGPDVKGPSDHELSTSATALPALASNATKVPLEAHIMSKCPDARDCLVDLVVPAMEQVVDKVDFTLSYIGNVDKDDNVKCKHGQTECLGNMMMLCAAQLYPNDVKISLGFSTCLAMSYQRIPQRELVQDCALEHGVDFEKLNGCISEEGHGLDLLESSVIRSKEAGVTKSCTVRVNGEKWCIRDGGEWKECAGGHEVSDLVAEVDRLYQGKSGD